jgi:hypothetical protein
MAVFVSSLPPAVMRDLAAAADCEYVSSNMVIHLRRKFFWKNAALLIQRRAGITLGVYMNYHPIQ